MEEIWKDIPDYFGQYQVSNFGHIRSFKLGRAKTLKPRVHNNGYLRVSLSRNGIEKDYYIHRLVANVFIPEQEGMSEINHIDGDKTNNMVSNLEWSNRSNNEVHKLYVLKHGNNKRVRCIETNTIYDSLSLATRAVNGSTGNLAAHLKRKKKHNTFCGYHWEYVDNS